MRSLIGSVALVVDRQCANGQKAIASGACNSLLILLQADSSIFTLASKLAYEEKKPKQP
ncbi:MULTISPECIES: hypothetical protein [Herbaspirillum]|jgi:hypothetical protein|nr:MULTISPECIES: hypothetical protein [Herbaspirillum]MBN9356379.1 hypothetical protein [Herbaspirillum huttiense]MCP3655513.1 hypothetical protein [Herbaspirillum sp.]MCP3945282.1 hypothetical protein [Herbaspirillum sp.]MCP4034201.1 hypothetical protein [Herbaspirillum sp.]MCP4034374.1 hypothetical protein [Herbaspirillum sp.]|tara:strand:+ start:2818 stop:2994 length:177 start_codon:yes stop_codon:yes gene_type:complete